MLLDSMPLVVSWSMLHDDVAEVEMGSGQEAIILRVCWSCDTRIARCILMTETSLEDRWEFS